MVKISVKVEVLEKETVQIYRMSTLDLKHNPVLWVSAYLIDGLLIDCGHHHAKEEFLESLDIKSVDKCVLSHHHEDHFGACYDLQKRFYIPICANIETAFLVRLKLKIPHERELVWGTPKPCKIDIILNSNEITTKNGLFKVVPSPGHCNPLISFFHEKKKLLFSTDALIDEKQNVIFNWENALKMIDTFQYFKKLNPRFIFLEDGRTISIKKLNYLIDYWNSLKKQSEEFYSQGLKPKEIVKEIFGRESWLKVATGGDMSRENLIRSLLNLPQKFRREKRKRKKSKN